MIKLYRFRAIDTCESVERAEHILRSGEFWCSRFWEMNDPMEGIYRLSQSSDTDIEQTFEYKASQYICCFSGCDALKNPSMWGYYANGFKGVAIEVEVDEGKVEEITYDDSVQSPEIGSTSGETAKKILCRKLEAWKHECEYRFLSDSGTNFQKIGEITGLIVGCTYPKMLNHADVDGRWAKAEQYTCRVKRLLDVCELRRIPLSRAQMKGGVVKVEATDAASLRACL